MNSKSLAFLALLATLTTTLPAWADYTFKDGVLTLDVADGKTVKNYVVASKVVTCGVKFSGKLRLVKTGSGTLNIAGGQVLPCHVQGIRKGGVGRSRESVIWPCMI